MCHRPVPHPRQAPAGLAEAVAFLLSDAASGSIGALVPVTARG